MYLNNSAIKRIAKDVKYIITNEASLSSENIYYKHDEENAFKGYALIIGNKDTPYAYGYYFFEFIFPETYPFAPPQVNYLTNDGTMRFNPNLYSNGKVCLSILNTWAGESWSSCQSIHSILFTLVTILCDNPLLNEPGVREQHSELNKYNYLVFYKNVEFSIATLICLINDLPTQHSVSRKKTAHNIEIMRKFKTIVNSAFETNKTHLLELINANKIKYCNFIAMKNPFEIVFYNLIYSLNYNKLYDLIDLIDAIKHSV
jgi:ubiquitin-protein ligase